MSAVRMPYFVIGVLLLFFQLCGTLPSNSLEKFEQQIPSVFGESQPDYPAWVHLSSKKGDIPTPGLSTQQTASLILDVDKDVWINGHRRLLLDNWTYIQVDDSRPGRAFGLAMGDLTGDGYGDIVSGSFFYRNPGGDMTGKWQRGTLPNNVDAMMIMDVDGDNLADVIAENLPDVYWLEEEDNQGSSWNATKIGTLPQTSHQNGQGYALGQIIAGGKPEILLSSGEGIYYFRIPDNPGAGNWHVTHITGEASEEGIGVGDINSDGDVDIAGGTEGNEVAWWMNPGDSTEKWAKHLVGTTDKTPDRIAVADINNDKRPDVVVSEETPLKDASVYWFEQTTDPKDSNWLRHKLVTQHTTNSMDVGDMDSDGDVDIITGEHRGTKKLVVWENVKNGSFWVEHTISTGKESHLGARVSDLDSDGDLEIASIAWDSYQYLHLWRNDAEFEIRDSKDSYRSLQSRRDSGMNEKIRFQHIVIDAENPAEPHIKAVGDIDGDGVAEIVVASSSGGPLVWYKYPNWTKYIIAPSGKWSCYARILDMDGDGDQDILISEWYTHNRMEWYENPGPKGDPATDPWKHHIIGTPRAHDICVGDVDGDGHFEIVTRTQGKEGNSIVIRKQRATDSWVNRVIDCPAGEGLDLGDIDGDGRAEVIIGGRWYEPTGDILKDPWKENVFSDWHQDAVVKVMDINKDGRLDVVLTRSEGPYRISWFDIPPDPVRDKWTEHIISDSIDFAHSLAICDIDRDGNLDVVTAEMHQSSRKRVLVYLNEGGAIKWSQHVIATTGSHNICVADVDGDGNLDIVGANWSGNYQPVEIWKNMGKQ